MLSKDLLSPTVKTAKAIGVKPLSEKDFANKYASRKRVGKTARDKAKRKGDNEAV